MIHRLVGFGWTGIILLIDLHAFLEVRQMWKLLRLSLRSASDATPPRMRSNSCSSFVISCRRDMENHSTHQLREITRFPRPSAALTMHVASPQGREGSCIGDDTRDDRRLGDMFFMKRYLHCSTQVRRIALARWRCIILSTWLRLGRQAFQLPTASRNHQYIPVVPQFVIGESLIGPALSENISACPRPASRRLHIHTILTVPS